mmetsp:Transcript_146272/g.407458  ORF Transcript_146272/g.407458 Transcript_146272/m.407458 type:complete len:140 (-) Transcript_146272:198-617(-)
MAVMAKFLQLTAFLTISTAMWVPLRHLMQGTRDFTILFFIVVRELVFHSGDELMIEFGAEFVEEDSDKPAVDVKLFPLDNKTPSLPFGAYCIICLSDVDRGQSVGQMPCGHAFHEHCINDWLALRKGCPMRCVLSKDSS